MSINIGRYMLWASVVSRGWNGVNPTWLGFAYGYWFPRMWLHRYESTRGWSLDFAWLCFIASVSKL